MLYMVLLYDPKGYVCSQVSHNLAQSEAETEQVKLLTKGQPAFFLRQSCTHLHTSATDAEGCKMCYMEIQQALMLPQTQTVR
jgi:hypothetical protein